MAQSTKLIEIVNANQKEVNRLKKELDELQNIIDGESQRNQKYDNHCFLPTLMHSKLTMYLLDL